MGLSATNRFRNRMLAAMAATVLAVVVGEVVIRLSVTAPEFKSLNLGGGEECVYQRSSNAVLGFELKRNYSSDSPDFISTYERTNAFGLRDQARSISKPPGATRVLLLGDSVVEGYGLPESQTISSQLQSLYEEADEETEVFNFGVSAYCTRAEVELLETRGLLFSPDVVVLVFVENDFDNFNREAFPLEELAERPAIAEFCFKKSHLFRLASVQLNLFQFRRSADPAKWNSAAIGQNNVTQGLQRLRQLANQHQFQPLVAIWPRFEDTAIEDVHFVPNSNHLVVEAIAAHFGIPSFRMSDHFQTSRKAHSVNNPRLVYSQGDGLHPSPAGANEAARAIYQRLVDGVPDVPSLALDLPSLEKTVERLSQAQPEYSRVYNRMGNQFLKQGELQRAIKQYRLALKEDPESAEAHGNLGIALERMGGPHALQDAIAHYQRAIELWPEFAEAHLNLGNALEPSEPATAQQHFIQAVQIQPNMVRAHVSLCRSLYRAGRLRAAELGLRQALAIDAENVAALLLRATIQTKQGKYSDAKGTFVRLLQLDPEHAEAHNNLAAVLVALGDHQSAMEHLKMAVEADPQHPQAAENLRKLAKTLEQWSAE